MKRSLIALEYLAKSLLVGSLIVLANYFEPVKNALAVPFVFINYFPIFAVPIALIVYMLWALPIAPRGDMGNVKKYIVIPCIALAAFAAAAGAVWFASDRYKAYRKQKEYDKITDEINAFVQRADERLIYIDAVDPSDYPQGIYGSNVDISSVYIDYDTMEIAFVLYDWVFKDSFYVYKLEQQESKRAANAPPLIGDTKLQTTTLLNAPGQKLYSYNPESNGRTEALALIRSDGTVWTAEFDPEELDLYGNIFGIELCHKEELEEYKTRMHITDTAK